MCKTSVEDDFVAASSDLRFLISSTVLSREIRQLLHPSAVLNTELPDNLFLTVKGDGPLAGQTHGQDWQDRSVSLAREVSKLLENE